ncbi:uncharacterized protein LOC143555575 [Bidens hawaiensis]|uniref:uncharacterized protein LOC143555575 n=1 Tax=Bidens hawaiensis TaxID=980011 RepID=UPI00404B5561
MGGDTGVSTIEDDYETLKIEADESRITSDYDDLMDRVDNMELHNIKTKLLSYTPGSWVENVGGVTMSDYNVPKTTTLLIIGPKGSGKSSLVNRITRVFEDDKFAPERAQVTYNSSIWDGTCFLQEYMVPRNSTSFCLYDTRGFSSDLCENLEIIKQWMTKGVRNGEFVKSATDRTNLRARMKCKARQDKLPSYERRRVDFVIFVVNGLSVLKCMESSGADTQYMHMVTEAFSSPFLSFKDHKPVIAITRGDLLPISERARIRVYLGLALGVHPSKQTFDIPDNCEPTTDLTIVDLVRYALEHADRNLPCKSRPAINKGSTMLLWTHLLLLLAVGIFLLTVYLHGFSSLKLNPECAPELSLEVKKVIKCDQESVPKPDMKINKVTEIDPEIVPEPSLEIRKVMEFDQESVPEPHEQDLEIKEVKEMKKVIPESVISKPRKKTKKAETKHNVNKAKPIQEIDWKTIRHVR